MSTDQDTNPELDENKLIAERRGKLRELREAGNAYPNDFRRTALAGHLQAEYGESSKEDLEAADREYAVAGRLVRNRGAFLLIQDDSASIQLYINRKALDEDTLADIKSWDLGDIVAARGPIHKSGKGDLYINMVEARLLTKALRPLPDKYHGLADQELGAVVEEDLVEMVRSDHHQDVRVGPGQRLPIGLDLLLPERGLGHLLLGRHRGGLEVKRMVRRGERRHKLRHGLSPSVVTRAGRRAFGFASERQAKRSCSMPAFSKM